MRIGYEKGKGGKAWSKDDKDVLEADLTKICSELEDLSKDTGRKGDERLTWFGSRDPPNVADMLTSLHMYLNKRCMRLTFVSQKGEDFGAAWQLNAKVGIRVSGRFLVDDTVEDYRKKDGYLKVQGGLRIYLENGYFKANAREKVNTIFHEITHKVIMTNATRKGEKKYFDETYGEDDCKKLRILAPKQAIRNADNWGYFMADAIGA